MASTVTINKHDTHTVEAPVRSVSVAVGKVYVSNETHGAFVVPGEPYEAEGATNLSIHAIEGSNVDIQFTSDPEPTPAVRGDKGGQTGSYESRTVEELRSLAKEREIPGYSRLSKNELIEALRS